MDLVTNKFSLANARELALYARMAYDEPPTIRSEETDTNILIRNAGDYIVIAPRGTKDLANFITDAKAWRTRTPLGGIHAGFYEAFESVREQLLSWMTLAYSVKPKLSVLIGAHSLGASLGMLIAKCLRDAVFNVHSVYGFGCPRPADKIFRDAYNATPMPGSPFDCLGDATFALIDDCDAVARMPGWLAGYRRPGHDEFISSLDASEIVHDPAITYRLESDIWALFNGWRARRNITFLNQLLTDHHIDKYIAALAVARGDEPPPALPL